MNLICFSTNATLLFPTMSHGVKCRELMYGELTCLGRHTVTGMLAASGNQFVDWSGSLSVVQQTAR
jgi:hypothetical protein